MLGVFLYLSPKFSRRYWRFFFCLSTHGKKIRICPCRSSLDEKKEETMFNFWANVRKFRTLEKHIRRSVLTCMYGLTRIELIRLVATLKDRHWRWISQNDRYWTQASCLFRCLPKELSLTISCKPLLIRVASILFLRSELTLSAHIIILEIWKDYKKWQALKTFTCPILNVCFVIQNT